MSPLPIRGRHAKSPGAASAHSATPLAHRLPIGVQHVLRDLRRTLRLALYRARVVPPPRIARIHVTDACNFRCPTCSKREVDRGAAELSTEQWRAVFARLARWSSLRHVTLSGGEPFVRADLCDLIAAAAGYGLRVSIVTNGWAVDAATLARAAACGAAELVVSLNSLREEVHDESRARPGSYRRIMELLEAWRAGGRRPALSISTVVMDRNCGELAALAGAAREWGTKGIVFQPVGAAEFHHAYTAHPTMPSPPPRWWETVPHWVREPAVVGAQCAELLRLRRRGYPILNSAWHLRQLERYFRDPPSVPDVACLGAFDAIAFDPIGSIGLCAGLGPIGNVLEDDPVAAWRSARAREVRAASRTCHHLCRLLNCNV